MKVFLLKVIFAVFVILSFNKAVPAQSLVNSKRLDSNYIEGKPFANSSGDIFLLKRVDRVNWFVKFNSSFVAQDSAIFYGGITNVNNFIVTDDTIYAYDEQRIVKWKFKSDVYKIRTAYISDNAGGSSDYEVLTLPGITPDASSNLSEVKFIDLDIDKNKNVYVLVTEGLQETVYKYNSSFNLLSSFKYKNTFTGFSYPTDIAVDKYNGSVYLLNSNNQTVEITKYNSSGVKVKSMYPTITNGYGTFELELDSKQELYFTSTYTATGTEPFVTKILKYSSKGDPLSSYTLPVFGLNSNVTINPAGNFLINAFIVTKVDSVYTDHYELREYTLKQNSYVTFPENGQVDVNPTGLKVLVNKLSGATAYNLQISLDSAFSSPVLLTNSANSFAASVTYGKKYFVRASSSLNPEWGPVYTFKTIGSESITYVTSPVNKAVDVPVSTTIRSTTNPLASSYTFQISGDSNFVNNVLTKTSSTTSVAVSGLLYNQVYYTRVSTNDAPNKWGKATSFTTIAADKATAITSPVNGKIDVSPINLKLTAAVVSGAASYQFDVSTDSSFRISVDTGYSKTVSTNTAVFTELVYGRTYYCRVKTDISGYSKVSRFTTIDAYKVLKITSPASAGTGINPASVKITALNIQGGASVYVFELSADSSFANSVTQAVLTNSTTYTNLAYNKRYFVRVRTNVSQAIPSPVVYFETVAIGNAASIYNPANNSTSVSLNPKLYSNTVAGASLYKIQISTDSSFKSNTITNTSANPFYTFTNLVPNTKYFTRVGTNLDTASWGAITRFTTIGTAARLAADNTIEVSSTDLTVFPNPSESTFSVHFISASSYEVEYVITDISGAKVEAGYLKPNQNNIVGETLTAGTYLFYTQTADGKKIAKLIKL